MQVIKIDLKKIDQSKCFKGKNGAIYLDGIVFENDEPDQFGYTQIIYQSVSKEDREKGIKGKIIGNGKEIGAKDGNKPQNKPVAKPANPSPQGTEDDIPF